MLCFVYSTCINILRRRVCIWQQTQRFCVCIALVNQKLKTVPICKKFSNSIHPTTIPKTNKEIEALLKCLFVDSQHYLHSAEKSDKFISHFQKSILPKLGKESLLGKFSETVSKYAQTELIKTTFVATGLSRVFIDTIEHTDKWMEKHSRKARLERGEPPPSPDDSEWMPDLLRIAYGDFIHLSVLLSQMFFALEFSCRTICALGCYNFALRISQAEVIQHDEVWKQLKRFGERRDNQCQICIVRDTCDFEVDFNTLARIYAYSMKIRQIADYTTRFASLNILNSHLAEPPFFYFASLMEVMETNFHIAKKCFPSSYLMSIPMLSYFAEVRKNLYPPISWTNTVVMKSLQERDDIRRKRKLS